jgi:biopolymer transport protein ExbB
MSILLQIQQTGTVAADTLTQMTSGVDTSRELSLWELILKGGPIMIPIALLSIAAVFIFFERWFTIRRQSKIDPNFLNQIRDFVHQGNIEAALSLSRNTHSPVARMVEKGLKRVGRPLKDIEDSIENVAKLEVYELEKNLGLLGSIAGIAPMFGFLGTIFGVITIFYNISLADNISIGLIAGGLYEKMITSAAGLMIGIFSYLGYHYLIMMVDRTVNKIEVSAIQFIDMLQEPTRK